MKLPWEASLEAFAAASFPPVAKQGVVVPVAAKSKAQAKAKGQASVTMPCDAYGTPYAAMGGGYGGLPEPAPFDFGHWEGDQSIPMPAQH